MRRPIVALVAFLFFVLALRAQPTALSVNVGSREEVRQFYRAVYSASENVPMGWTGSYATGNAGNTSSAFKEATRLRINFFRALVGVPAGITLNATFSAKAQQAALMMSANNALSHFPPSNWTFYTADGREAAENSNLYLGASGAEAVTGYMVDPGDNNAAVGHRRWLIYPQTQQMGTGDVAGDATRLEANAIWVFDTTPGARFGDPRPATRTTAVPYPPAGFVPHTLVFPRWSFTYPGADFASATVTMTRNGQSISAVKEPLVTGVGEPTLVWIYDGQDANALTPHSRPTADVTYSVTLNNVRIGAATQSFTYNVVVFDPDRPGTDTTPVSLSGPATAQVGANSTFSVTRPAFVSAIDWRTVQLSAFSKTYDAESGLAGIVPTTSGSYSPLQSFVRASGTSAYYLTHALGRSDEVLLLPETFHVGAANAALAFSSRLGLATSNQVARVQVSGDDAQSWSDVYVQPGTTTTGAGQAATDAGFTTRTVSLSEFVGRTIRVRFNYTVGQSGSAFPQSDPATLVGWFIDNITLTGVSAATAASPTRVANASTISVTPTATGTLGLQARGVLFSAYPMEWGPLVQVNVTGSTGAPINPGRLMNLSILTSLAAGEGKFTLGYVVGGANTSGNKPLVIRAAGPALAAFSVPDTLANPKVDLFTRSVRVGGNDDWGGSESLSNAMAAVGAFFYTSATSRDAAIAVSLPVENHSVEVTAADEGTGAVIAEIYDATPSGSFTAATPRLMNVSVLKSIGARLTAGFVIEGDTPLTVLVRAIGPSLASFGVPGPVQQPRLEVFRANATTPEGTNEGWTIGGNRAAIAAAAKQTGAFELPDPSNDAALLLTLPRGQYSAVVTGAGGTTGMALVEVYEVR